MMAWRRPCDEPLSEPISVSLLTHICVTRPHWDEQIIWASGSCAFWAFSWKSAWQIITRWRHMSVIWRLESQATSWFNQQFVQARTQQIKTSHHWRFVWIIRRWPLVSTQKGANDAGKHSKAWRLHRRYPTDTRRKNNVIIMSFWRNNDCAVSARYHLRGIILGDMLAVNTYICWKEHLVERDDHALSSMTADSLTSSCYIQT